MSSTFLESSVSIGIELEVVYEVDYTPENRRRFKDGFGVGVVLEQVQAILKPVLQTIRDLPEHERAGIPSYGAVVYKGAEAGETMDTYRKMVRNNFVVGLDSGIAPNDRKDYGVEISTPAFTNGVWRKIIPIMMKYMTESGRFKFNPTTALHIHLGKGIGQEFSFEELSRISKAIILFEKQLGALHPTRNPTDQHGLGPIYYKWCTENPRLKNLSMKRRIELIDSISNSKESSEKKRDTLLNCINYNTGSLIMSWERYYTYNLGSNQKYGTIEFRQAAATLNHVDTLEWIETAICFTLKACQTEKAKFLELAERSIQRADYAAFGVPEPK